MWTEMWESSFQTWCWPFSPCSKPRTSCRQTSCCLLVLRSFQVLFWQMQEGFSVGFSARFPDGQPNTVFGEKEACCKRKHGVKGLINQLFEACRWLVAIPKGQGAICPHPQDRWGVTLVGWEVVWGKGFATPCWRVWGELRASKVAACWGSVLCMHRFSKLKQEAKLSNNFRNTKIPYRIALSS